MSAKRVINSSINLPVESVQTIIDVNDRRAEVGIVEAMRKSKCRSDEGVQSMNTIVTVEYDDGERRRVRRVSYEHSAFNVNSIDRRKIEKTNDLKFFRLRIELSTGVIREFTVPSYVKLFSSRRGMFIPVEYVRNRDILIDYSGNIAKVEDASPDEGFRMTDFYSISATYEIGEPAMGPSMKTLNECNFYLNGVLSNVSYNNFQKKDD